MDVDMKILLATSLVVGLANAAIAFIFRVFWDSETQLLGVASLLVVFLVLTVDLLFVPIRWRKHGRRSFLPLASLVCCIFLIWPASHGGVALHKHIFRSRLPKYQEVIGMIQDGSIQQDPESSRIELPASHSDLAYAVFVRRDAAGVLAVEFLTGGGFPVKHSGWLYLSDDTKKPGMRLEWHAQKVEPNWYMIWD